jgi:hypothetical protein
MSTKHDAPLSAAEIARLVDILWRGDLDVRDHAVYDDESFVAEFDYVKDAEAYAALHNAAPSLLAEAVRLRKVEEAARELLDYMGKWEDDTIPGLHWQQREDALRAALSPSPEVGT